MESVLRELAGSGPFELAAVLLALAYLVLAARLSLWCWPAAFASSTIYLVLFADRQLYQQSLLQMFYVAMAVYGLLQWRRGIKDADAAITRWQPRAHAVAIGIVLTLTVITGALEARYTDAALPYLDAFTTWGSVVTTWMVVKRVLENWLYWIVFDSVMLYVSYASGLVATAGLFLMYVGIAIAGYIAWRRRMVRATPTRPVDAVA